MIQERLKLRFQYLCIKSFDLNNILFTYNTIYPTLCGLFCKMLQENWNYALLLLKANFWRIHTTTGLTPVLPLSQFLFNSVSLKRTLTSYFSHCNFHCKNMNVSKWNFSTFVNNFTEMNIIRPYVLQPSGTYI